MASRNKQIAGSTNPILTKFAQGYRNPRLIAERVVPVIPVLTESGTFYSFGKDGLKIYDVSRAVGNPIPVAVPEDISSGTYQVEEHSIERYLDEREIAAAEEYGAAEVLNLKKRYTAQCQNNVLLQLEKAVADSVFAAGNYATGNKITLSGGDQFSDYNNSDPIGVIDQDGKAAARSDMGVEPNILVIGYTAWQTLKWHPQLTEKLAVTGNKILTTQMMADLLGFEEVIVGQTVYADDDGNFTDLWGDYIALLYRPPMPELVEGTTPHTVVFRKRGYPVTRVFPAEQVRTPIAVQDMWDVKLINTSYGYLISDTVA